MSRVSQFSELKRVAYSVFVMAAACFVAYNFVLPSASVDAQKFEKKPVVRTEQFATTTFPTSTALPLAIPDNSAAGTSLDIPVAGLTDEVRGVALNITFDQPAGAGGHTWVGDLNVVLSSPAPANVHTIFSRTGSTTGTGSGDSSDAQGPYTFTDGTTGDWWATALGTVGGTIAAGSYKTHANASATPTDMNPVFQGPALTETRSVFKSAKETKTIPVDVPANLGNGLWNLAISDNAGGDTGRVAALSLTITTLAPTAAHATIQGRVLTAGGLPISRAAVSVLNTDSGQMQTAYTNHFGYFTFEGLPVENFYSMWVEHGRYTFSQQVQNFVLNDDITDAVFVAQ